MKIEDYLSRYISTNGRIYNEWCDNDETILRMVFDGDWSWIQCFWMMLRAGVIQHRDKNFRGMIYDLSSSAPLPDGVWLVGKFEWIWEPKYWPESMTRIVVIGNSPIIDEIFEVREKVAPHSIAFFKRAGTLDEAINLINHWDQDMTEGFDQR